VTIALEAPPKRRELRRSKPKSLRVIAVWGSPGSGKSTIALNLATELSAKKLKVLLIDADTHSPSQTTALAITDHPAGLAPMLRFARQNRLQPKEFDSQSMLLKTGRSTFTLIPGINPNRWSEVTPQAFELLVEHASTVFDFVVIDCSSDIEPNLYSQAHPLPRNEFTRWLLKTAELVIATFAVDPVSMARFLSAEPELQELRASKPIILVANRLRNSTLGPAAKLQVEQTFKKLTHRKVDAFLPNDPKAQDASLRNGTPLIAARRGSALRKAIAQLVRDKKLAG
jgi:cellulose biosynthesis protein BcsQ